jgi:hypothetical protein
MRNNPKILAGTLIAGLFAACGSGRDWRMPEFPSDPSELVRFQEAEQAQMARGLPEPEHFAAAKQAPQSTAVWSAPDRRELGERLQRTEQSQAELISGLASTAPELSADPQQVGTHIARGLEQQGANLDVLKQGFEAALQEGVLGADQRLGSGLTEELRAVEAGIERRLIRLADADAEQLTRLAQVEQRNEQLGQVSRTPAAKDQRWLFGLVSLGLLALVAPWLWLRTKVRSEEQQQELDRLAQDLGRLDERQELLESVRPYELPRPSDDPRPQAVSAAGAAALALADAVRKASGSGSAATAEGEGLPNFELPRSQPRFEQRKQDLDPVHTPARHLAPFAGQPEPEQAQGSGISASPSELSASARRFASESEATREALPSAVLQAVQPAAAPATGTEEGANREEFELNLVRQLAKQRELRQGGAVDSFEAYAERLRTPHAPAAPDLPHIERELAWTRNKPQEPQAPSPDAGQANAVTPAAAPEAQRFAAELAGGEDQGLLERLAKLRPGQSEGRATDWDQDDSEQAALHARVIDPPWAPLSPLPAAEQSQARFETELEKAFNALEQERLNHEAELRQALDALDRPASGEEFLASEDEEPRS